MASAAAVASTVLDVDAADVLRVIGQHLREAGLHETVETLQREAGITLDVVDDAEALVEALAAGKWEAVLRQLRNVTLPTPLLFDVYEQLVLELRESGERDVARTVLRQSKPFARMRRDEAGRVLRLERMLARGAGFNPLEAYRGTSKEVRRKELATRLGAAVTTAPPSRLLALITQALKWQQTTGRLPPGAQLDLLHNAAPNARAEQEKAVKRQCGAIRFGAKSHAEAAVFTPDGASLITGSVDGFVEVWNTDTCKLRLDLAYQASESWRRSA